MMEINKSILITALARNCEGNLLSNLTRLEQLRKCFHNSYVVIIENDSIDNTKEILKQYKDSHTGVTLVSKDYNGEYPIPSYPKSSLPDMGCQRIAKMAYLRNELLTQAMKIKNFDYLLSIDIDVYSFSVEGIIKVLKAAPSDWGALFANGHYCIQYNNTIKTLPFHYDFYAYIPLGVDISSITKTFLNKKYQKIRAFFLDKRLNHKQYVKVLSGFCGIGVYKREALEGNYYEVYTPNSWNRTDICLCEHVTFHSRIKEKGLNCYIGKEMEVIYGVSHKAGFKGFLLTYFPVLSYFKS